jgi:hypothetical protein
MTCCGKTIKSALETGSQIAEGYTNLAKGKKYEFTDSRIRACRECDKNYWIIRRLFCSICKCYIPAKARAKDAECPLDRWPDKKGIMKWQM